MSKSKSSRQVARRWLMIFVAAIVVATTFSFVSARALEAKSTPDVRTASHNGDWLYVDHDVDGTRYSPLNQITLQNVQHLARVCSYSFPDKEPSQTAPIVAAGVMYLTTAHYTVALDGSDCRVLWSYQWKPRGYETFNTQRGAAIAGGKIIRGTADDFLIALNAKNGHLIWARQIANPREGYFISMAPLVHDGLIYIGPAGSEWASKGWVGAFKLSNGEQVWKFNIVPDDGEAGADTWGPNPAARKHGGGDLWTPLSFDIRKDLLYVPGGNAAPDFYDNGRPGANLYTDSIIALDAKTGRLVWYEQFIPHDVHDYDITHVSPVFTVRISGKSRSLVATSGKDGLLRVVDRNTHNVIYSVPITTRLSVDVPLSTARPVRVCPGTLGGEEWNGSAYSPKLDLLVAPATDWCDTITKASTAPSAAKEHTQGWYFGGDQHFDKWSRARGWLTAFDASTGKMRWRYAAPKPMIAGVTITAGNLVFTGQLTGDFIALDAQSGKVLWRDNVGGPIAGGVVSYAAAGVQHVAVVSGFVGIYNTMAPEIGGGNTTVTVFALPTE